MPLFNMVIALVYLCMYLFVCMYATVHIVHLWRSELVSFLLHVGPRDRTQVLRLGSKLLLTEPSHGLMSFLYIGGYRIEVR